jgi:hypothetical protein
MWKQLDNDFMEYVQRYKIYADKDGKYWDNSYGYYITPALLEACKRKIKPRWDYGLVEGGPG